MKNNFDEVFEDVTKLGTKIRADEYHLTGKYQIIDQGQEAIAGYTDLEKGLLEDVPTIIFGDHTRIIKYVDKPFFLGADGVKVLRSRFRDANYRYLFYALRGITIPNTGYNRHFRLLKESKIEYPSTEKQVEIVSVLEHVSKIIEHRQLQLQKLDELVKSRFVELFGDPVNNSMGLKTIPLGKACCLKAGITTPADMIHEQSNKFSIPCYGGNGIRGYVESATQSGCYPIIGRQGALCGNVQLATGKFHATEHAVLVTPLIETNVVWLFYLLKMMDLYRFHTGAAQPGLAVKTLNTVDIPIADVTVQHQFATFVEQTDKSKVAAQKALDEAQLLFDSLMQKYFG